MGRRTVSERSATEPDEVFFRADGYGRLQLVGYSRTLKGRATTFSFQEDLRRRNSPKKVNQPLARAHRKDDLLIVMARPH